MKRRKFLAYSSAASATALTGCAASGLSPKMTGIGAVDTALRDLAGSMANNVVADQLYSLLGIPNRLAFVSGRPLSAADKTTASEAQALFRSAGTLPVQVPTNLLEFNFAARVEPRNLGKVQITSRSPLAWPGLRTRQGREQIERAAALRSRYSGKKELNLAEFFEVLEAHRPFAVALHEAGRYQQNRQLSRRLVVAPNSAVTIPFTTGCLGAGLPLPRSGEGTRLIHVGAAVDPESRPMVYGLLNYAKNNTNAQLDCQNLIWALVHADNSSYANLALRVAPGRQRDILEQAVPGGYAAFAALLENRWARREQEAKKLKTAKLLVAQLNALAGTSFNLVRPSGVEVSSSAYTRNLLQQGFDQGTSDLSQVANNAAGGLINGLVSRSGLSGSSQNIARTATKDMAPAISHALLGAHSPFDPLQGYTLMRPGVGAHVSDIGGVAGRAQLMIANGTSDYFDFNPNELGAITPRRTQAQAIWPDFAQIGDSAGGPLFSNEELNTARQVWDAFGGFVKTIAVEGIDGRVSWLFDKARLKGYASASRAVPILGTALALYDIHSYLTSDAPLDFFGEKMDWADFSLNVLSLVPAASSSIALVKSSSPFLRSQRPVAESWTVPNLESVITLASPVKGLLTSELLQERVYSVFNSNSQARPRAVLGMAQGSSHLGSYGDPASAKLAADISEAFRTA